MYCFIYFFIALNSSVGSKIERKRDDKFGRKIMENFSKLWVWISVNGSLENLCETIALTVLICFRAVQCFIKICKKQIKKAITSTRFLVLSAKNCSYDKHFWKCKFSVYVVFLTSNLSTWWSNMSTAMISDSKTAEMVTIVEMAPVHGTRLLFCVN